MQVDTRTVEIALQIQVVAVHVRNIFTVGFEILGLKFGNVIHRGTDFALLDILVAL